MNKTETDDACHDCGKRLFNPKRETGAITMRYGKCQYCGGVKLIVPAMDWKFMQGDDSQWD